MKRCIPIRYRYFILLRIIVVVEIIACHNSGLSNTATMFNHTYAHSATMCCNTESSYDDCTVLMGAILSHRDERLFQP